MRFASPWMLIGMVLIPAVLLAYRRAHRRAKGSFRFPDVGPLKTIRPSFRARYRHLPLGLRLAALLLLLVALGRPQSGSSHEEILTRGIDIVVAVDNSTSMAAEDLKPHNRLEVAKQSVASFIEGRKSDRIGMVVFAGRGYTRCPLTLDYDILRELLARVDLATQDEGTAIGMGLVTAINRLRDSDARSRVVVLLTDGRSNRGEIDPSTAASLARSLGIKVYTIGVGTKGEAPYPVEDPFLGKRYVYLKADIDEETLTSIAESTGGRYFRATDAESLNRIFEQIDAMEKTEIRVRHYVRYAELFPWFLWPGAVLFLTELALAGTLFRKLP